MATLHLIFSTAGFHSCLETAHIHDQLLLIEDGVYAVLHSYDRQLHVIEEDLVARGVQTEHDDRVNLIDYSGMVDLVAGHQPIVSWH